MKDLKLLLKISALKVKEVENYVSLKGKCNKAEMVIEELDYLGLVPEIIINWFFKKKEIMREMQMTAIQKAISKGIFRMSKNLIYFVILNIRYF